MSTNFERMWSPKNDPLSDQQNFAIDLLHNMQVVCVNSVLKRKHAQQDYTPAEKS